MGVIKCSPQSFSQENTSSLEENTSSFEENTSRITQVDYAEENTLLSLERTEVVADTTP